MSLDLSTIKFQVNTDDLVEAVKKIETLGTSVEGLATSLGKLDKSTAQANKTQAQANLTNAKAEKELAKAIDITEKTTAATEKLTKATREKQSVEERQEAITRNMSEGYSRGQASILATAEAAGEATDRIGELLKTQRAMQGTSPFDKSLGAATIFANELRVLTVANDLYNQDLGFTKNQLMELGREHVRMTEQFKIQGKSLDGLNAEFNNVVQSAQKVTQAENAMAASMKNADKATVDAGKANAYIESELQKVRFALQANNEELNRGTANSLVRFENALKKSGLTLDQQKVKIDEYRKAQVELQKTTAANKTDYITRAVGPQITDIVVGLSTGQSPLTVMMQQGGQLRDQFGMMGIAAKDMGDVMRNAMKGMASSVFDTGKAIGTMLVGGIHDAGKAVVNFGMNATGMNSIVESGKRLLAAQGEEGFKYIGMLNRMGAVITGVVAVGLALLVTGFIALGVALKQVIAQESELSKAMNLSAGSIGLTTQGAQDLAKAYGSAKGNVGAFSDAITESAKAGSITQQNLYAVTSAAIELEKVTGIKISETVKSFSKLADEPSKALTQLAKDTGLIAPEIVAVVIALEDQGKKAEAAAIATRAYSDALKDASGNIRDEMGTLQTFFSTIGSAASDMWNRILNIGRKGSLGDELKKAQSEVSDRVNGGARIYQTDAAYKEELVNLGLIVNSYQSRIDKEKELGDKKAENAKLSGLEADSAKLLDTYGAKKNKREEERTKAQKVFAGLIEKAGGDQERINYLLAKESEVLRGINDQYKDKSEKKAKLTEEEKQLNKAREEYIDIQNKAIGVNKDFNNQLERQNLLFTKGEISEEAYIKVVQDLIKTQPFYIKGLADEEKAQNAAKKAAEEHMKLVEEFAKIKAKFIATTLTNQTDITNETASLKLRNELLGKTEEEQKKINLQYKVQGDITKINLKYDKQRLDLQEEYLKLQADGFDVDYGTWNAQINESVRQQGEEAKLVWAGVAMSAAEDMQKEFDAIKSSITDVIVTSLFDGGKAGSKKLRDQVVAAFRNKITVVIDAVVNTALSGVIGNAAAGTASSGIMGSIGSSALGQMLGMGAGGLLASPLAYGAAIGTTSVAAGSQAAMLASQTGVFGAQGLAATSAAAGGTAGSISAAMSAIPGWGWALMAGVAAAAILQGGETRSGATYGVGADGKATKLEGPSGGEIASTQAQKMFNLTKSSIEGMLTGLGSKAVLTGFTAGLESSEAGKGFAFAGGKINGKGFGEYGGRSGGQFTMGDKTTEQAIKDYQLNLSQSIIQALQVTEDIPASVAKLITEGLDGAEVKDASQEVLNSILSNVDTITKSVNLFSASMTALPFEYLKNLSFDTAAGLIATAGGLETLMGNLNGFYSSFYTEQEQYDILLGNTTASLAKLGIVMPKVDESTRAWYRSEVERLGAMDQAVEANRVAYTSALGLWKAVDTLAPAFDSVGTSVSDLAESARQAAATMVSSWASIMQARGVASSDVTKYTAQASINAAFTQFKTTDKFGIKSAEQFQTITQDDFKNYTSDQQKLISVIISGYAELDKANTAVVDVVRGTVSTYSDVSNTTEKVDNTLNDLLEAARRITETLRTTSKSLEIELMRAQGDTKAADLTQRAIDTEGYTEAQVALYDYNNELRSQITIAQEATEFVKLQKIAQDDYAMAVWEATGDTASMASRQRELATATKLAAGWTQSMIDDLYGYQEAQVNQEKLKAEAEKAASQQASNSSALLGILAETYALTGDVALAESTLWWQRTKEIIALKEADPSGELAAATMNLWKLKDAASAAATYQEKAAKATEEANRIATEVLVRQQEIADQFMSLQKQWWNLTGDTVSLREEDIKAIDSTNHALQRQIWAYEDAQKSIDAATSKSDTALKDIQTAIDAQKTIQTKIVESVKSIFDSISDAVKSLYAEVETTREMQANEGRAVISNALSSGVLPDQKLLTESITTLRSAMDQTQYSSQFEGDFNRLVLAGQLQQLAGIAGTQLTDAEAQLSVTTDAYEVAKVQLEALRGIDSSVLSVAEAVEAFQVALTGEKTARQQMIALKSSSTGAISSRSQETADNDPMNIAATQLWASRRIDNIIEYASFGGNIDGAQLQRELTALQLYIADPNATQNIPAYEAGTNYVPNDGLAYLHEGEAVVPKQFNLANHSQSLPQSNRLEGLITELTLEVKRLQTIANEGNTNSRRTANAVNGNPEMPMIVEIA